MKVASLASTVRRNAERNRRSLLLQQTFAVNYGGYEHLIFLDLIDDTIAIGEYLAHVLVLKFRDPASGTRELRERLRSADDRSHNNRCVGRRVLCNVLSFEIATARRDQTTRSAIYSTELRLLPARECHLHGRPPVRAAPFPSHRGGIERLLPSNYREAFREVSPRLASRCSLA